MSGPHGGWFSCFFGVGVGRWLVGLAVLVIHTLLYIYMYIQTVVLGGCVAFFNKLVDKLRQAVFGWLSCSRKRRKRDV